MSTTARTFAEKLLARASGHEDARAGEIVTAEPDLYMSHTASWRCIKTLDRLPGWRLRHPERIAMVMDHTAPARTAETAGYQALCRDFAAQHGIETFYDVDAGVSHVVLIENGHIKPGMLIIGTDLALVWAVLAGLSLTWPGAGPNPGPSPDEETTSTP